MSSRSRSRSRSPSPRNRDDRAESPAHSAKGEDEAKATDAAPAADRRSRSGSRSRRRSRSRSPVRRREETSAGNNEEAVTLHVGNLSFNTNKDDVRQRFEKHGEILDVRLVRDPATKQSRGFAFVQVVDQKTADKMIDAENDTDFDGRLMRVAVAKRSRPHEKTPGRYLGPVAASSKYRTERSDRHDDRRYDDRRDRRRDDRRGGYDDRRYDDRRGGYDDRRDRYDDRRGDRRGGYDDRRGGYDDRRGGYDRR